MQSRQVTVFGAGYVGLVTGVCLAASGHRVTVLDVDETKLAELRNGLVPFHEPDLQQVMADALATECLSFDHAETMAELGEFVFVAVGTPSTLGGSADLRFVRAVIDQVVDTATTGTVVVMKSTVPPGTGRNLSLRLAAAGIEYVSNPEFLREGRAVTDWFNTDRIVLGGHPEPVARVASLYENIDSPVVSGDITSAELIKYASNAFLATKISFANEIANLCDCVEADVALVMQGVGLDGRIGPAFLNAGIGYGGSCFPKDTRALDFLSSINGHDFHLLKAGIDVNSRQRLLPIMALRSRLGDLTGVRIAVLGLTFKPDIDVNSRQRLLPIMALLHLMGDLAGKRIAVLGLTFKPDTDDTREAPAADIIGMLLSEGAIVDAFDPVGTMNFDAADYRQCPTLEDAVRESEAVLVTTEWHGIVSADWPTLVATMESPRYVYDGRNCLDADSIRAAGGTYVGVGRR